VRLDSRVVLDGIGEGHFPRRTTQCGTCRPKGQKEAAVGACKKCGAATHSEHRAEPSGIEPRECDTAAPIDSWEKSPCRVFIGSPVPQLLEADQGGTYWSDAGWSAASTAASCPPPGCPRDNASGIALWSSSRGADQGRAEVDRPTGIAWQIKVDRFERSRRAEALDALSQGSSPCSAATLVFQGRMLQAPARMREPLSLTALGQTAKLRPSNGQPWADESL
jgi:predicted  nucleic acid-binding Zn-ribbon protein